MDFVLELQGMRPVPTDDEHAFDSVSISSPISDVIGEDRDVRDVCGVR